MRGRRRRQGVYIVIVWSGKVCYLIFVDVVNRYLIIVAQTRTNYVRYRASCAHGNIEYIPVSMATSVI